MQNSLFQSRKSTQYHENNLRLGRDNRRMVSGGSTEIDIYLRSNEVNLNLIGWKSFSRS